MHVFCTIFLLLAIPALAQEHSLPDSPKPKAEAPKPKHDRKVFVTGVSLLAASKTADAITTRRLLDRGGWKNNPVFGRHRSPAKQAGRNAGILAAQSALFLLTEHNRHARVRWAGRAFIGHAILEHSRMAACNAGLNPQGTQIQKCLPLVPHL
ncbi:MAG TPA: hypothetical protein VF749_10545 [Candidatus Acidoferrum sp.]